MEFIIFSDPSIAGIKSWIFKSLLLISSLVYPKTSLQLELVFKILPFVI